MVSLGRARQNISCNRNAVLKHYHVVSLRHCCVDLYCVVSLRHCCVDLYCVVSWLCRERERERECFISIAGDYEDFNNVPRAP